MSNGTRNNHTKNWIRKDLRLAIYLRDKFTCLLCEKDLHRSDPSEITLDHYIPRSLGGDNTVKNLFTCCHLCNSTRQANHVKTFKSVSVALRVVIQMCIPVDRALAKALLKGEISQHESET